MAGMVSRNEQAVLTERQIYAIHDVVVGFYHRHFDNQREQRPVWREGQTSESPDQDFRH